MDSDKPPRLNSNGVFPPFSPFMVPTSSPSLFPQLPLFAQVQQFQQIYNSLMQNPLLFSGNNSAQQSPTVQSDLSPISDEASGRSESPSVKS
ncbi:hypothetical protein WR25_08576 [Diploscapter pachys]|uniref:Uncharacterized protein n=1 Tax=Diploscapter pachys TaxID=2018661 RepID=A0A2A2JL94_9BILA|nr:hypothetical protein WR25_08576 [Diploscapter pachys]